MKASDILKIIIGAVIGLITPMLPALGGQALDVAERAALVPEKDVERIAVGMDPADVGLLKNMFRRLADTVSDIAIFVASRGKVRPDGEADYK